MDLVYLHWLQELRGALPRAVEWFFVGLSYLGNGPALIVLVLAVYWCVDKREGQRALTALALGVYANQLIKNIACIYRPWIRDSGIVPSALAIAGAGGYSFPSGHTTGTASALGSLAWQERHQRRWVVAAGIIITMLMMFARNFLGVHTPQDVVVGLLVAVVAVAGSQLLCGRLAAGEQVFDSSTMASNGAASDAAASIATDSCGSASASGHVSEHSDISERELATRTRAMAASRVRRVLVSALAITAITVAYVALKAYPLEYVDGVLLVDPNEMRKGCFEAAGLFAGWAIGWALERRYVGFSTTDLARRMRIVRFLVGAGSVGAAFLVGAAFKLLLPYVAARLLQMAISTIAAAFVAPAIFCSLERR